MSVDKTDIIFVNREELENLLMYIEVEPRINFTENMGDLLERAIAAYRSNAEFSQARIERWLS